MFEDNKIVLNLLLIEFCVDRLEEKLRNAEKLLLKAVKTGDKEEPQRSRVKVASFEMEDSLEFIALLKKRGSVVAMYVKLPNLEEILGQMRSHLSSLGGVSWKKKTMIYGVKAVAQWMTVLSKELVEAVADTPRTSNSLKISEDGKKVGQLPKPEEAIEQVDTRTVAASPLPDDVKLKDVDSFFTQFGKVNKGTTSDEGDADKEMKENNGSEENQETASGKSNGDKEVNTGE